MFDMHYRRPCARASLLQSLGYRKFLLEVDRTCCTTVETNEV